jgi:hypothetical protein
MSGFQVLERYYPIGIPIIVFSGSSRGADQPTGSSRWNSVQPIFFRYRDCREEHARQVKA